MSTTTNTTNPTTGTPILNPATNGEYKNAMSTVETNEKDSQEVTLEQILAEVRGIKLPDKETSSTKENTTPTQEQSTPTASTPVLEPSNTGNAALDVAIDSFLSTSGATSADIEKAIGAAIQKQDATLVDTAFIKERFGDKAEAALKLATAAASQIIDTSKSLVSSVHTMAGSKESWDLAVEIFKKNAPESSLKVIKSMMDSGDIKTTKDAAAFVLDFSKKSGSMVSSNPKLTADSGVSTTGLSATEFKAAIHKLNANSRSYNSDYAKLVELRRMGKTLGR